MQETQVQSLVEELDLTCMLQLSPRADKTSNDVLKNGGERLDQGGRVSLWINPNKKPQEIFTKERHHSFKKTNIVNRLCEVSLKESSRFKGSENFKVLESLSGSGRKRKTE